MPRKSSSSNASTSPAKSVSEKEFTAQVIKYAKLNGWRVLHIRPARRGTDGDYRTPVAGDGKGFPDLLMLREERMVIAELKVKTKKTPAQVAWLQAFMLVTEDVFTWHPWEWDEIESTLRR